MGSIEKYLEKTFCDWCKTKGAIPVKGPANMYKGIPDRVVALPHGGGTIWVEFKGGTAYQLTDAQKMWRRMLIDSAPDRYFVIDSKEDLKHLIQTCEMFMRVDNPNNM